MGYTSWRDALEGNHPDGSPNGPERNRMVRPFPLLFSRHEWPSLSLVRAIAHLHGGEMWLKNHPDGSAAATVALPAAA